MGDDPHFIVYTRDTGVGALSRLDHDRNPGFCISQCCIRCGIVIPNIYSRHEVVQFPLDLGRRALWDVRIVGTSMQANEAWYWDRFITPPQCLKSIGKIVQHFFLRKKELQQVGATWKHLAPTSQWKTVSVKGRNWKSSRLRTNRRSNFTYVESVGP